MIWWRAGLAVRLIAAYAYFCNRNHRKTVAATAKPLRFEEKEEEENKTQNTKEEIIMKKKRMFHKRLSHNKCV